jgi:class 3 adenylate cyclase
MAGEATHHWIMVLDVENFSSRRDPVQRRVRAAMYRVLAGAMERAGLAEADTVSEDRGDGVLMLIRSSVSPVLIAGPLVRELDVELGEYAQESNAEHALRLRVALHQGLAARDERGWSGDAVNTACRLVDAQPLRDVLAAAPSARMVFAVSAEVHRGVIRHGHRGIDPAAYLPCDFTTKHGETISSWITVPGYPAPPGLVAAAPAGPQDAAQPTDTAAPPQPGAGRPDGPAARPSVSQHAHTVQGDQVAGDKHVTVHTTGSVRP